MSCTPARPLEPHFSANPGIPTPPKCTACEIPVRVTNCSKHVHTKPFLFSALQHTSRELQTKTSSRSETVTLEYAGEQHHRNQCTTRAVPPNCTPARMHCYPISLLQFMPSVLVLSPIFSPTNPYTGRFVFPILFAQVPHRDFSLRTNGQHQCRLSLGWWKTLTHGH